MKRQNISIFLSIALLCTLTLAPGCTPESPPLDPIGLSSPEETSIISEISDSSGITSESDITASSYVSSSSEDIVSSGAGSSSGDSITSDVSTLSDSSVPSDVSDSYDTTKKVFPDWNEKNGKLVEISFRYADDNSNTFFMTDDPALLDKLNNAISSMKVSGNDFSDNSDHGIILLYTSEKSRGKLTFERGILASENVHFSTDDYTNIKQILKEVENNYPEWRKKYSGWNHRMSMAENRIREMTYDSSFTDADIESRHTQALTLLKTLENENLVKKGSIYDSGDTISFTYNCDNTGVNGAIMIKDFDPMMN